MLRIPFCQTMPANNPIKKHFSEIILITNTVIPLVIEEWLKWHIEKLGFDHIIVVDNSDTNVIKTACAAYGNVTYIDEYRNTKISQTEVYNRFVNGSESVWCLPIDDDEFLYLGGKKANDFFKEFQNCKKISFENIYCFMNELTPNEAVSIYDCRYYLPDFNAKFPELKQNIVKTACNTTFSHFYVSDFETFFLSAKYSVKYQDSVGTVHNPLTIIDGNMLTSVECNSGDQLYGMYSNDEYVVIDQSKAYILHNKYKSIADWNKKIRKNIFSSCMQRYYDREYKENIIYMIYSKTNEYREIPNEVFGE